MFILPKSPGLLLACAAIGLLLGAAKGRPVWGLMLGALLGPLGWGLILALPRAGPRRPVDAGHGSASGRGSDPRGAAAPPPGGCPRCGEVPAPSEKACRRCGNVLIPVHYEVLTRNR